MGEGVRWLDLDEDISVVGLIAVRRGKANGRSSSGSERSVQPTVSGAAVCAQRPLLVRGNRLRLYLQ